MGERWVTFDCFGTLVDWRGGFSAILRPIAGPRTPELVTAYHRFEPDVEAERPHRSYRAVLAEALRRAAAAIGLPIDEVQARSLPERWDSLAVFDDVEPALAALRDAGWRLGVLTNCDEDLFAVTQRGFGAPFDLVVTAERVRDYKPSPSHFRFFSRTTGARSSSKRRIAASWTGSTPPTRGSGRASSTA